jgi:hypothetical protein
MAGALRSAAGFAAERSSLAKSSGKLACFPAERVMHPGVGHAQPKSSGCAECQARAVATPRRPARRAARDQSRSCPPGVGVGLVLLGQLGVEFGLRASLNRRSPDAVIPRRRAGTGAGGCRAGSPDGPAGVPARQRRRASDAFRHSAHSVARISVLLAPRDSSSLPARRM